MNKFPLIHQPDSMDCGPACLGMIAKHYGKDYNIDNLRANSYIGRDGVSLLGISRAAENIGFKTVGGRITFDKLAEKAILPCVVHWKQDHFVVVYAIKKSKKTAMMSMWQTLVKVVSALHKRNFAKTGSARKQVAKKKALPCC